ncbi:sterol desaturase family protein [Gracilimonas tropica]|uniref:sterol desaturase family protein n=1 Tax=Gracilimonas tropica TaxID=454600 RepID=UPI000362109D|nr:sterol desaturase family protein [Gracilimonas tropica]
MDREIKNNGQGILFENSFLEPLTKSPPYISAITYSLLGLVLLAIGVQRSGVDQFWVGAAIFAGALFFWTLFEYFAHRYLFHIDEYFPESAFAQKLAYTLHGIHHEFPRDTERIIMPPVPGLMILGLLFLVYFLLMGNYVYLFLPGFITGYLLYTRIHYKTHVTPVPSYLKSNYKHHALHHYKYPEKAFGISTTLWDRVFGTMPPED